MFKYIEKYKSQALYMPALYRNALADCIHGKNDILLKKLSEEYPTSFLFRSPEMAVDFLSMEDLTVNPLKATINSKCFANWKCHVCGFEWKTRILNRRKRDKSRKYVKTNDGLSKAAECPACIKKARSVATKYPQLLEVYDESLNDIPLNELSYTNNGNNVYCRCKKHGSYKINFKMLISCLSKGMNPCGQCANEGKEKKKRHKYISLANEHPELCAFWSDKNAEKPQDYSPGSHKVVLWKCPKCGYEWKKQINEMVRHPSCPNCSQNSVYIFSDESLYKAIKAIYDTEENEMALEKLKKEKI